MRNTAYKLYQSSRITVSASATLASLIAAGTPALAAFPDNTLLVLLYQEDSTADIRYTDDGATAASATTPRWPAAGEPAPMDKAMADKVRLYSAAAAYMTVQVFVRGDN